VSRYLKRGSSTPLTMMDAKVVTVRTCKFITNMILASKWLASTLGDLHSIFSYEAFPWVLVLLPLDVWILNFSFFFLVFDGLLMFFTLEYLMYPRYIGQLQSFNGFRDEHFIPYLSYLGLQIALLGLCLGVVWGLKEFSHVWLSIYWSFLLKT
jgi:hypothetical protein